MALPKLETPTYELTLPSTGKQVTFRPFLVKEHKILLTITEASNDEIVRVIKQLIDVCTFNKLDVENLPHFDIEYIFMQLRAKSISEVVDVVITCGNCEEKYETTFTIEDLKVENQKNKNNIVKITDKIAIQLQYPKFDSIIQLIDSQDAEKIIEVVKNCVVGVYDEEQFYEAKDQTPEEIEEFLYSLTKDQFALIEEFFVKSPKIVQEFESTCTNCSHVNKSRIEGIQNFFV